MIWRYLAFGLAAVLLAVAGWIMVANRQPSEAALPPPPPAAVPEAAVDEPEATSRVPGASERTREEKRFDRYDKDRDGRITREEYLASRRKAFAKLDKNGDGRLSFDEWAVRTTDKFAKADRDRSGSMSRTEFATTAVKRKPAARCACARSDDD